MGKFRFVSTATWLAWRTEISPSAAREHVRVARALGGLQLIDEAFAEGKLSYSKVRAITRVATPETEQAFLDIAMHTTAAQIERREVDLSEHEAERADALVNVAQAYLQHDEPRTLGSGYELVMMNLA